MVETRHSALGARHSIAVICALEEELCHLRAALPPARGEWHGGRFYEATELGARPIVLARCGIGMLSAAAVAEGVIGRWQPGLVLNYGCTGAHRDDLLPGDIVVGERAVAYDSVKVAPDGGEEFKPMYYLRAGEQERAEYFAGDPALLAAARRAIERLEGRHEPWPPTSGWPTQVPHREPRVAFGTVASADRWNRSQERIASLVARHGSHCEDMEAAAIALVCASHDVPFLTVKDISNNELLRLTSGDDFDIETAGQLGKRAAVVVRELLREVAERAV
jgi:adenosylhomocysteine nucleosidase